MTWMGHDHGDATGARLHALCGQVGRELGVEIFVPAGTSAASALPAPLRGFYRVADGLVLPFATIYAHDRLTARQHGWTAFGRDPYFRDFLCRLDAGPGHRIAVRDRETAISVEAVHDDVVEMLADLYAEYLDDGDRRADLRITAVPDGVDRLRLVAAVKPLRPATGSRDHLAALRNLPATLADIDCAAGIRVVRTLHTAGVAAHLTNVGYRDADTRTDV